MEWFLADVMLTQRRVGRAWVPRATVETAPAGTVSGAPKVRAMEILAEIEKDARGPYAGAFGYVDRSGNLDMAITIRTFALKGNRLSFQAGAGVVFDSNPEREYEETLEKSGALVEAAELAGSGALEDSGPEEKP